MIGSLVMALRYSFALDDIADLLDRAIDNVLASGRRTPDIAPRGCGAVGTGEMGDAIIGELDRLMG